MNLPAAGPIREKEALKKKIPEIGTAVNRKPEAGSSTGDQEAERFFSSFKNNRTPESLSPQDEAPQGEQNIPEVETAEIPPAAEIPSGPDSNSPSTSEEPSCAIPVDIGVNIPPAETAADLPPDEKKTLLITEVRRGNLSLAAALEKARRWEWTDHTLLLIFDSSYEAAVVKNESETLRQAGKSAGLEAFTVDTRTEAPREEKEKNSESPRVTLIRQVFRGQIVKG